MSELIRAEGIEMSFGKTSVLSGVSLRVEAGESVGIVGPNGAGKTTLMKILAGVLEPDAGGVFIQGDRLRDLSRRQIAGRMAVVPQGSPQVFNYSVLEFVLMGHYARSRTFVPARRDVEEATEALDRLGIGELADRPVSHVSGGELQRALMARAIVAEVPLWLLDEPTSSLDVRHRATVLKAVRRHGADRGATIAILHDLELVHRFFDRVVALAEGRFRASGPPDEVLTPSVVSKMYGVAMKRGRVDGQVVWIASE